MVNQDKLKKIIDNDIFAWDAILEFDVSFKSIVRGTSPSQVLDEKLVRTIKTICVGKKFKNPIEAVLDFSNDKDIVEHFFDNTNVSYSPLDINSDIAEFVISFKIPYGNKSSLPKEIIKKIIKANVKTFYGRYEI